MILIDTNILMYASGSVHRHREPSGAFLERIVVEGIEAAIDAEVLQEILHRYRAIQEWEKGRRIYDQARAIFQVVIPITAEIVDDARLLMDTHAQLQARDALHAAVCRYVKAERFCSYDQDFDSIAGLRRVEPEQFLSER